MLLEVAFEHMQILTMHHLAILTQENILHCHYYMICCFTDIHAQFSLDIRIYYMLVHRAAWQDCSFKLQLKLN